MNSNNTSKIENVVILSYSLIDMRTGFTYGFKNLSDTATCLHIYNIIDNEKEKPWGATSGAFWIYITPKNLLKDSTLTDTTIAGILYNRIQWIDTINRLHTQTTYARCDKKRTYFQYYYPGYKKDDCPITIVDDLYRLPSGNYTGAKFLYKFEADALDSKMKNIFTAWEKRIDTLPKKNIVYKSLLDYYK